MLAGGLILTKITSTIHDELELAVYKNTLETYWYIKSKKFSNANEAFNALETIHKGIKLQELNEVKN